MVWLPLSSAKLDQSGLSARQTQNLALSFKGPVLLLVSGSNFGALTQAELSVAFAPGDLNICLQGR